MNTTVLNLGLATLSLGLTTASPTPLRGAQVEAPSGVARSPLTLTVREELGELEVQYKGRRVMLYAFAAGQFKPYVKELYTLKGDNLLRDAPADHLHHHGLMYAIKVNGINFWEEGKDAGHQRAVKLLSHSVVPSPAGLPQGRFTQLIHWVAGKDKALADTAPAALLVERRTLTLTVDEGREEVALEWHGEFEPGAGAAQVTLSGADYHGLGLRLPQSFDRVARHQNSANAPYTTQGKRDVLVARWSAVSHSADGRAATVAVFARPDRTAGVTRFFSMLEPFAYLSVTQSLDQKALEYGKDSKFSLNYLVLAHPGAKDGAWLQKRYEAWTR